MNRKQENLNDFIIFIVNIIALGRFGVEVYYADSPIILNILIDITDIISSAEYRSFNEEYERSTKRMAHTSVANILNIFVLSVRTAKSPRISREVKVTNTIKFKHLRMDTIVQGGLLKQLNPASLQVDVIIFYNNPPLTFK